MNKKSQTLQKYINAVNEMFDIAHFNEIHYTKINLVCEKFKIARSLSTYLVAVGVIERIDKGYYRFKTKPTAQKIEAAYLKGLECVKASSKRSYDKRKAEMQAAKQQNETTIVQKLVPINEQVAIEYLKSKGYKIMKPIQQFEEV